MVDVLGHLGMALVWLAPSWYVFDRRRTAAVFVAATFWFGMLPDVDLVLSNYLRTIHHHGIFHTVFVVSILAVVIGPLVGWTIRELVGDAQDRRLDTGRGAALVGIVGVWVAGLSHIFADILSAPDVSQPIEPLWPIIDGPIVVLDVVWYSATWANWGLFVAGIAINVGLWYLSAE